MPSRLVILVSGNGSNLQALLDACVDGVLDAEIVGVLSNKADAYGLVRAADAGAATRVLAAEPREERADYDRRLAVAVADWSPDLVVLAGWMRILTMEFLARFDVVNLHPALPGSYPGTHAIERAFADWQAGLVSESGVMVHRVPDEGVDVGPVVDSCVVPFEDGDTLESFEARMHAAEHRLIVDAVRRALTDSDGSSSSHGSSLSRSTP